MKNFRGRILETKKPSVTQTVFNYFLILTQVIINQFRLSRDDDDNDVMLKNWVSLFKIVLQM
ncbi:hypothetical protein IQ37_17785 [Chryseobacterium piperi]|uniref:Uncharacterized protein n=1 Tax=Chryseobacterium piperi TaxID=558152 RepID=A0A086AII0_9FLAO|nr:hypothetical protein CJF12_04990 [Chryseobacterium piperi]KFF16494.1 hypothetical protein IQ37_17785 [Chryseobacterium piperi]